MTQFFEDICIGDVLDIGVHTFSPEEIIRYAEKFDPQPYHLSEEAAQQTHFGRLCASGWHTASIYMRLLVLKNQEIERAARQRGAPIALIGPSPGLEELKWRLPVFAGDTISYKRCVSGKTESRSRPDWGIVHGENHGTNQNGETVFSFKSNVFVQRSPR
ncbi:MaoC family dehydratase [Roseibium algae]|uniref:MaoC family dehydratase n=1 Tax=Roseibium algae TaxID=3123038 RepID=A0ABU8TGB1_9HYPH